MSLTDWHIAASLFALSLAADPLLGQRGIHAAQPWPQTALHVLVAPPTATHRRSAKSVEIVIALGAEVNARDQSGSTPLKALIPCRDAEIGDEELRIIEVLAQSGADLNLPDNTGSTPLACAIETAHFAATARLIALGAELNPVLPGGQNYVHLAARLGTDKADGPQIMQALIVAGVDFNTLDDNGRTPMHYAVEAGNQAAVSVLLRHTPELVPIGEILASAGHELEISGKGAKSIRVGERLTVRTARGDYSIFAGRIGPGRRRARTSPAAALRIQKRDKVYRKQAPGPIRGAGRSKGAGNP